MCEGAANYRRREDVASADGYPRPIAHRQHGVRPKPQSGRGHGVRSVPRDAAHGGGGGDHGPEARKGLAEEAVQVAEHNEPEIPVGRYRWATLSQSP